MSDTIFALASARGKAGLSVVRLSGPKAHDAARLFAPLPAMRQAGLRRLMWNGALLDEALVLAFGKGASFTGEDVVELHLHGSRAVVAAVIAALSEIPGLRPAEAGEFTRRALENGCLDLTQVEGLADLIDAETEAQRVQSLRVLSGAIGERVRDWRGKMIRAAALLEATIDFADEDVPEDVLPEVRALLDGLLVALRAEVAGAAASERIRDGFEVAIVGRPNAGKSTLLNSLAGRNAAITSEVAGTTRDVIEVRMDLQGLAVTFLDTAGLRETDDLVEALGVSLAIERAQKADLRVFLQSEGADVELLEPQDGDILAMGKADIFGGCAIHGDAIRVSGRTGEGVSALIQRITEVLSQRVAGASVLTRERHRIAIAEAVRALEIARIEVDKLGPVLEIASEELRIASRALQILLGEIDVETLLGEIFSSFCIGK
ncbi:tRNA uridine-5-carboxymethylaminomethyl(34) synthesis GTPase MnmE [Pseudorhodobacter sp. E13]|uniref:tRNA uridine-5-carboxymethylaminomethyl(34) synthesis GTPase MnmE n=1 Tax=Pseudorhodobacter sp. E13 TaxID=2487931 RepID=UPI000F8D2B93|nr:tRNA uridine-5-carboxymethylaminomethyl(34) synthesis GTPase MnmE [Pseudorhodobacter sp. E13]RUS59791.1 tRNA uridine-5-carboxymethylaminomethyl(34) synthesis GTPase MnmE [Pseudorhodobacter sp. E13]